MALNIEAAVADLQQMTARELREKYAEVVGEQARSGHKTWLIRRIAWHLQARQEGDLSERARRRARELANDADVRVTPPKGQRVATGAGKTVRAGAVSDPRLSGISEAIVRKYKGQQFNTATSMGRLVLNVLLSFAQFEREIIGERIRDKIAAQRRKGKWTGGTPILGFDVDRSGPRPKLAVNAVEAARVREIFALYPEDGRG
jgi:hypothetical protein